ncbi:MAG TPA: hybrid sensor histidine kinase/response regulator, partial [Elainellaceae cyanobacterium]
YNSFLLKPIRSDDLLRQICAPLNLSWVYEPTPAQHLGYLDETIQDIELPAETIPPAAELQTLYRAARIGDITGVEQEAHRLQQMNDLYSPLAGQLLQLVETLDEERMLKLVEHYCAMAER